MNADKQMAASFLAVALFAFIAKIAGAAKEIAIAWRYGSGAIVDAYALVSNLYYWPIAVLLGTLSASAIPTLARIRIAKTPASGSFLAELSGAILILALGITLLGPILVSWLVDNLAWQGSRLSTARQTIVPLALMAGFGTLAALQATLNMANKRHSNTLLEAIPALSLCFAVLLFEGIHPLVWGSVAGYAAMAALLTANNARNGDFHPPRFRFSSPVWSSFLPLFVGSLLVQAASTTSGILDSVFAATLPAGELAHLSYASRLLSLALSLVTLAAGRSVLPILAESAATGGNVQHFTLRWCMILTGVGLAAALLAIPLSPWLIPILFERGAFDRASSEAVSRILQVSLLQLPLSAGLTVLTFSLYATLRRRAVLTTALSGLFCKVLLASLLTPLMGMLGILLSSIAALSISFMIALIYVARQPARDSAHL